MKKVKLSLNKSIVSRLQNDEQNAVVGGQATLTYKCPQQNTIEFGCIPWSVYPYCKDVSVGQPCQGDSFADNCIVWE